MKKKAVKKVPKEKKGKKNNDIVTNPNGANQYQCDPRQKLCWEYYINPKSETFSNGLQSAIKAGYDEEYANQITTIPWFLDKLRRLNLLDKAEKVLEECLEMPVEAYKSDLTGEKEAIITSPALVKIKQDTAKFIAERLGKTEGYTTRTELTGADGKDLMPDEVKITQSNDALKQYLNGVNGNTTGK